jgi:indolepyruvate ferredoxin oxidoreductase
MLVPTVTPVAQEVLAMTDTAPPPDGAYRLQDRYLRTEGTVLLTGIQALARIPIDQLRRDREAGRRTAAFCSGYPGSPLGGLDQELSRALALVPDLPIVHQPAVNEELGATAVMGSQLVSSRPDARYDGVVGIWYGKAPGLDRAGDALRHGVFAGASSQGGAVVLVGDDPASKSSTMPSSSDATLVDLHMPVLYPGTVAECVELGLHAVALSRSTGLWSAMKIVTPIADGSGTVELPAIEVEPEIPSTDDGRAYRIDPSAQFLGPRMLEVERQFREVRLPLANRYGALNGLNRVTAEPGPDAWIGLVATGFTYHEVLDALRRLGLAGTEAVAGAGIRLLQLRMPVPFDAELIRGFANGLEEILVIEEKNPTLEWLIKDALYGSAHQPRVVGKTDPGGHQLMRSWGPLDADAILPGLRRRLAARLADRLAPEPPPERERVLIPLTENRAPAFCSGCPHNWGTKVPDGALVGAGTGCHGMILLMDHERVGEGIGVTAMGNEGVQWIGMEPFVEADHLFQNYGDGTYLHSGQLAIQNCIGAGKHMTFKILWNDTVAMTGGQDPVHRIGVPELATILTLQGASAVAITTDDPGRYDGVELPPGVRVDDRTEIVAVQERLRNTPGVTILIHDQACAAELRRDRKRGRITTPTRRVVINHRVCEGCGDCGDVSGCLSVQPLDTPLGRRTTIDQASCNYDESCLEGDCPAFMTVEVDPVWLGSGPPPGTGPEAAVPEPPALEPGTTSHRIRMAGIGGTGVVTAAQILATAAMFDGWDVRGLDQTGLSQKAGPVVSDVVLVRRGATASNLVGVGQADVLIGFDAMVAAADGPIAAADPERTAVIVSSRRTPTGRMVVEPDRPYPEAEIESRLGAVAAAGHRVVDATTLAEALAGDAAAANVLLLGVAVQDGRIPVSPAAVDQAIELNGVAVDVNRAAFAWGRRWVVDPAGTEAAADRPGSAGPRMTVPDLPRELAARVEAMTAGWGAEPVGGLGDLVALLAADLIGFADRDEAARYLEVVERVAGAERSVDPRSTALTEAVARGLHKLVAYKDEYEVARLLLLPDARDAARAVGGDRATTTWHLHPPMLRAVGHDRKLELGRWAEPALRALRAGKRLRGTRLDPFGRAGLRRIERELPGQYRAAVDRLLAGLSAANLGEAVAIAGLPDRVRGYEDLKLRRITDYRAELADRLDAFG